MTDTASPIPSETPQFEIDRCWHRIGVWGDKSCPELSRHAHCRNCPVFSRAATRMLDREMPAGGFALPAGQASTTITARGPSAESVLIFRLASEWFALPTL